MECAADREGDVMIIEKGSTLLKRGVLITGG